MHIMPLFATSIEAIVFSSAVLLWILSEIIGGSILPWLRRGGEGIKKKDSGSVLIIRVLMYLSVLAAIFFAIKNIAMLPDWFFYLGIALMVAGIALRQWAILVLGQFFSTRVTIISGHRIVTNGPYRVIRHSA